MVNSTPQQQPTKKKYQKPALKVYGNIQLLTGTSTMNGVQFDALSGMNDKTS